jgi:UDP-N-acetyl-D-mannosaminuronic acid dehydrogenase
VVVALVAHRSFRRLAPTALDGKRVVDACGLWNRAAP